MRNAYTLVEVLVVVALIGILMGLVAPQAGRTIRRAREATCQSNLRNLHAACISFSTEKGAVGDAATMPAAGSYEFERLPRKTWHEKRGWVTWLPSSPDSAGSWPKWGSSNKESHGAKMREAAATEKDTLAAIKYGAIFEYTGREYGVYRCPEAAKVKGENPFLSYAMNEFFLFGWKGNGRDRDRSRYLSWIGTREDWINIGSDTWLESGKSRTPEASRLLLFAEREGSRSAYKYDVGANCVLHVPNSAKTFKSAAPAQRLGAHHDGPGRKKMGWVIFLDGHTEKLSPETANGDNRAYYLVRGLQPED